VSTPQVRAVTVDGGGVDLAGDLTEPDGATGVVLFAHGTGSSRHSPRNRSVAETLNSRGFATLLLDLLTEQEERDDSLTARHRFDIPTLASRLSAAVDRLAERPGTAELPVGLFGASTGAAAAMATAASRPERVRAVVSRGGRPDLAAADLPAVRAPTLLLVGGRDEEVLVENRQAAERLRAENRIEVIPKATHLFGEPGALDMVAEWAARWFSAYLTESKKGHR
jgi:dienelactone hydrolase